MQILPSALTAKRLASLTLAGGALATLFSFLGRLHWALDLFSHFHLQYAIVLVAVALCFGVLKERGLLAASLILLAPHLVCLGYYFPGRTPAEPANSARYKVISFNVLRSNPRRQEVLRYLQGTDADLIFLLESNSEWLEALHPLEGSHPHFRKLPRSDNFGMAIYSRHPIRSHEVRPLSRGLPCMITEVDWDGAPLTILGAHPIPPIGGPAARMHNDYLDQLGKVAKGASADSSVLLLGDLNTTPWSPCFRDLLRSSTLEDSGKHRGFLSSWHRFNPLFTLPLDHILHSPDLHVIDRWVGPALGSDHHAVGGTFQRGNPQVDNSRPQVP